MERVLSKPWIMTLNAAVRLRRLATGLLPSPARRFLGDHVGRQERLADATPVGILLETLQRTSEPRVWIDVGAYRGNMTLPWARRFPNLTVYAFEPNVELAAALSGRLRNYIVTPAAIAEHNGVAPFFITRFPAASSLLPLNPEGAQRWAGREKLDVVEQRLVATVRLETFMNATKITTVDFLKVDAQGADLAVIASAGSRLKDIARIVLEVMVAPDQLYRGAAGKAQAIEFLQRNGFRLLRAEPKANGHEENLTFARATRTPRTDVEEVGALRC